MELFFEDMDHFYFERLMVGVLTERIIKNMWKKMIVEVRRKKWNVIIFIMFFLRK